MFVQVFGAAPFESMINLDTVRRLEVTKQAVRHHNTHHVIEDAYVVLAYTTGEPKVIFRVGCATPGMTEELAKNKCRDYVRSLCEDYNATSVSGDSDGY